MNTTMAPAETAPRYFMLISVRTRAKKTKVAIMLAIASERTL